MNRLKCFIKGHSKTITCKTKNSISQVNKAGGFQSFDMCNRLRGLATLLTAIFDFDSIL